MASIDLANTCVISPAHRFRGFDHSSIQSFFLDTRKSQQPSAAGSSPLVVDFTSFESILELGCGSGLTAKAISARFGCRAVGLDRENCSSRDVPNAKYDFVQGDVGLLPAELRGRFDFVYSYYTWHYLPDKLQGLKSAHQALKLGGVALIDFGSLEVSRSNPDELINALIEPQLDELLLRYPNHGQLSSERVNIFDSLRGRQERRCCRVWINKTDDRELRFPEALPAPHGTPGLNHNFLKSYYL